MTLTIHNPYDNIGARWLRGEIHTHVDRARGSSAKYGDGYHSGKIYKHAQESALNFVCMSVDVTRANGGADLFGDVGRGDECDVTGVPAREIQNNYYKDYFTERGSDYLHVLTIGEMNGISICAHPLYYELANRKSGGCWKDIKAVLLHQVSGGNLQRLGVSGIEVYNGFTMKRMQGILQARYSRCFEEDCWDELLTRSGRRYWGFAGNDAFFDHDDHFKSFAPLGVVYAQVSSGRAVEDIVSSLRAGRFYSSTGLKLDDRPVTVDVDRAGLRIKVKARKPVKWKAKVLKKTHEGWKLKQLPNQTAVSATFALGEDWQYIRIQCEHLTKSHCRAWLQPITNRAFFREEAVT